MQPLGLLWRPIDRFALDLEMDQSRRMLYNLSQPDQQASESFKIRPQLAQAQSPNRIPR